ncbi:hypothetical protein KP509_39G004100 [Ceratopteris richardii]|nr:hypothetical protein KP509_39G004100 [Ceratopteris richardii]
MNRRAKTRNVPSSRPSAAPGRPSVSRRSSVVYGRSTPARVDARPINDKNFQVASMRKLVEYLTTHGYSYPIPPKLLPSGKDIHNMIEFLIHEMDPTFRLVKLEDDVPLFFKTFYYPFQISKSALYAAGSPHSWPNLLAALVWLVDLIIANEREAETKIQGEASYEHEIFARSYKYFMLGDDEACEALDQQIQAQQDEEIEALQKEAEQTAQQVMELDSKLQALESEPSPLASLETKKSMLLSDICKFNAYIQDIKSRKSGVDKKIEGHKQQVQAKEKELETLNSENQDLSQRVSQQIINVEEFDRMARELQRVEEDLQSAISFRKEKDKEAWDAEALWSKKLKQLEMLSLNCNTAMKRLNLPFEMHLNSRGETAQDLLGIDIKHMIRPQIRALQEDIEKSTREKWNKATDLLKENSVKEDSLNEKRASNLQLVSRKNELEAACKKKQESMESIESALERIHVQMREDEEKLKTMEHEGEEKLENMKKEKSQMEAITEQELQQESSKLLSLMEAVNVHVEQIDARCNAVSTAVEDLRQMASNNYIRKLKW